jgi:hypothetical protein
LAAVRESLPESGTLCRRFKLAEVFAATVDVKFAFTIAKRVLRVW